MRYRYERLARPIGVAFSVAVLAAVLLAGCGGGGGSASQPVVYEPNYVSSLDHLLHWQTLPVRVFFAVPANWTTYYSADLPATAALSWNQPGWQAFFVVADSAGQADVVCTFVDTPPGDWSFYQVGETEYWYNSKTGVMVPGTVSVTVTIHDRDGHALSPSNMRGVIAHELGHVLGISGHSPNRGDLMYIVLQSGVITPQERDLNTVRTAYQAYFGGRAAPSEPAPVLPSDLVHRTIE